MLLICQKIERVRSESVVFRTGDIVTPMPVSGPRWRRAIPAYIWLLRQVISSILYAKGVVVLNYLPLWNVFFFFLY